MSNLRLAIIATAAGLTAGVATYVAVYWLLGWVQRRVEDRNLPGVADEAATWLSAVGEG